MGLSKNQTEAIEEIIKESVLNKLKNYKPETKHMPFHFRLLGKDRMALFSFIHSLNTTFGTSIFEPVAVTLAENNFAVAQKQYKLGNRISEFAQKEIQSIINDLSMGKDPDKNEEIKRIRKVAQKGKINKLKTVKVDLFLRDKNDNIFLFDLKTAKPNIGDFKYFKRTLLEWIAIYLLENPSAKINSFIAIPYNPYYPRPYERWTLKGMLDLKNELKVAEEFWNFLGGENAYSDLLDCFERGGISLRTEIDKYFEIFK